MTGHGCARRCAGDAGQVAGIEVLPFGLLIFVVGSLLITNAWVVVDTKFATDAAAREAVRAYAEAPTASEADNRSLAAARDALAGHGRDPAKLTIRPGPTNRFSRCARVTMTVGYKVPALTLPWIGGYGHAFDVESSASEIVDPFRSGLPGEATC